MQQEDKLFRNIAAEAGGRLPFWRQNVAGIALPMVHCTENCAVIDGSKSIQSFVFSEMTVWFRRWSELYIDGAGVPSDQ
jgi:hypothetical protein